MRKYKPTGIVPMTAPANARATATAKIWLQRFAGIALGGLAGTAAAHSIDLWVAMRGETQASNAADPRHDTMLPPVSANEAGLQIAHTLITRARDLIARGEIKEAERFLAAAETLAPGNPALVETWKLLDLAKAKIELAKTAPATGQAERKPTADPKRGNPGDAARGSAPDKPSSPDAAVDFAEGVKEFKARNYNAALAALGRAAATGYAPAQNYLGYMYRHGFGVQQDFARALSWYQKAAAQNHAGAMNNIGFLLRQGLGVAQDNAEARAWFRKAAERGDAAGQYNFGQMLSDGAGADHREAAKWFRAAADQGHPRAAMGLAHLFSQGLGDGPDPAEAYFWYGVAARSGVEGAQRFRTALGAQLSAAQRQAADSRVAGWKLQNADGEGQ